MSGDRDVPSPIYQTEGEREQRRRIAATTLPDLAFQQACEWSLSENGTSLVCPAQKKPGRIERPSVYVIVSLIDEATYRVLYVGKSGTGFHGRRNLHRRNVDRAFCHNIAEELRLQRRVLVFERASDRVRHFGYWASQNDSEEMALLARFCPLSNDRPSVDRALRLQSVAA